MSGDHENSANSSETENQRETGSIETKKVDATSRNVAESPGTDLSRVITWEDQ